jgi:hypothetical protein
MANIIYDKAAEGLWNADIDWATANIKAVLVDTAVYTLNAATDEFLSDVTGIIATSPNLASKTIVGRVIDSADVTFAAVTGATGEALVIFVDTGTAATSRLIIYADTASAGLPVTPNGGDIIVRWNASGIATL